MTLTTCFANMASNTLVATASGEGDLTEVRETSTAHRFSQRVRALPASGIRHFFELIANMDGVISLGVGEPDFVTPDRFVKAGFEAVNRGETHYTSNYGILELREAVSDHLNRLYGVRYNPENEIIITVGVSEGLLLAPDPSPGRLPLEKDLAACRMLDGASIRRILRDRLGVEVWLDPVARSLGLLEGPTVEPKPDGVRYLPLR